MNDGVQQHTNRWGKFELMCVVFQLLPVSELPNAPICSQNPTAFWNKIQNGPYLCPLSSFFKGLNGLLGRDLYINTIFINCITKPFTNLVKYFLEAVAATHATPVDPPLTECKKKLTAQYFCSSRDGHFSWVWPPVYQHWNMLFLLTIQMIFCNQIMLIYSWPVIHSSKKKKEKKIHQTKWAQTARHIANSN